MELNVNEDASPEFPFYHLIYEQHYIRGCVSDARYGCKDCMFKSMCIIYREGVRNDV
jgi:hypothetical protein